MAKVLFLLCTYLAIVGLVYSCRCIMVTPEQHVCERNPDFVGVIQLLDDGQVEGNRKIFKIKICDVFKGSWNFDTLSTSESSASCGVDGSKNAKMIITATVQESKTLSVNSCSSLWTPFTTELSQKLEDKVKACHNSS